MYTAVAGCTCSPRAGAGRGRGMAAASWLPAEFQVQGETLAQKNMMRAIDRLADALP